MFKNERTGLNLLEQVNCRLLPLQGPFQDYLNAKIESWVRLSVHNAVAQILHLDSLTSTHSRLSERYCLLVSDQILFLNYNDILLDVVFGRFLYVALAQTIFKATLFFA